MTVTLTDFLMARIAEDEAVAATEAVLRDGDPYFDGEASAFERSHDPARVLAECEAKRRIVSTMQSAINGGWQSQSREEIEFVATRTLRLLALPYADHPDYREEWKP